MIRTRYFTLLLTLLGVLAACGNATPTAQNPPTVVPASNPPTAPPLPTVAPTTARSAAATAIPAATRLPAGATTVAPQPAATSDALPEGLTPEGYHYLGRADAPATLVMYSDFL
jgi:hypothetical protein